MNVQEKRSLDAPLWHACNMNPWSNISRYDTGLLMEAAVDVYCYNKGKPIERECGMRPDGSMGKTFDQLFTQICAAFKDHVDSYFTGRDPPVSSGFSILYESPRGEDLLKGRYIRTENDDGDLLEAERKVRRTSQMGMTCDSSGWVDLSEKVNVLFSPALLPPIFCRPP